MAINKKHIKLLLIVILIIANSTLAFADIPKPNNTIYVYDEPSVLSRETENYIINTNKQIEQSTGAQVVVAVVSSLDDLTIEDYAVKMFRDWGIGNKEKNNGVLLLMSTGDRDVRIEVGYGLEGAIPDGKAGRILDAYVIPSLADDNYDQGLREGFTAIINEIALEYNLELDSIDQIESLDAPIKEFKWTLKHTIIVIIVIILILIDIRLTGGEITMLILRVLASSRSSGGSSGGSRGGGGRSGGGGASRGF